MEDSILKSTKQILGLGATYTPFDLDVITHINTAFTTLNQLGIGPVDGFMIEDEQSKWQDFPVVSNQRNMVRSYVFLKVRLLFDPPGLSHHLTALQNQLSEMEWRLNTFREDDLAAAEGA